ncbi:hypothetical protein CPS_4503 [Colwellia psychrerythraea 34H]|uniref:Uncharacterized protein n=1 Tax=Colwellia psychrerythraea (strain 34H / ATCC BAA-681) TaxID=167879 RepID=Q47VM1_COLP3|nr:hypothetical protein CPS_4503 [Colwellia psychrerythraea 34H]
MSLQLHSDNNKAARYKRAAFQIITVNYLSSC